MGLGIGPLTNQTALGQALQFSVAVRLDADESLRSDCVSVEAQAGDTRVSPSVLRWVVEAGADAGERTLRVYGAVAIDEPVVTVNVHFNCSTTRLSREFVLLIDPPSVELPQTAQSPAPARQAPSGGASPAPQQSAPAQPSPAATAAAAPRTRRVAPAGPGSAPARSVVAQETVGSDARPAPKKAAPARPRPPAPAVASRLKLEAADQAGTRPRSGVDAVPAAASAVAAAAPASAASAPEDPAAQQARERLQALETALSRLSQESRATQTGVAELQARLREAQAERYANWLVYTLGALAALLSVALGVALWRRPAAPAADAQWWTAEQQQRPRAAGDAGEAGAPAAPAGDSAAVPLVETTASPMLLQQSSSLAAEGSGTWKPTMPPPDAEMAVEELIDLEQQAEFFVVLGQDEAAIELLYSNLDSAGMASPLPYLKLLEIHRRRGEREASERIRERFNRRFNAYAPEWQADPAQGRSLAQYPEVVAHLQRLWPVPAQAMRTLEALLFRRDGVQETFDLPAYRELLFLYSVARDLSEREAQSAGVDLLLPIDGSTPTPPPVAGAQPLNKAPRSAIDLDLT